MSTLRLISWVEYTPISRMRFTWCRNTSGSTVETDHNGRQTTHCELHFDITLHNLHKYLKSCLVSVVFIAAVRISTSTAFARFPMSITLGQHSGQATMETQQERSAYQRELL